MKTKKPTKANFRNTQFSSKTKGLMVAAALALVAFGGAGGYFFHKSSAATTDAKQAYWGASFKPGNVASFKCIDVDQLGVNRSGVLGNGTKIQVWECNGRPAQKLQALNSIGNRKYRSGSFVLYNPASKRCLDVDQIHGPVANNTVVQLWDCNVNAAQEWRHITQAYSGTSYTGIQYYYNPQSGKCMMAKNGSFGLGTQMVVFTCNSFTSKVTPAQSAQSIIGPGKYTVYGK